MSGGLCFRSLDDVRSTSLSQPSGTVIMPKRSRGGNITFVSLKIDRPWVRR